MTTCCPLYLLLLQLPTFILLNTFTVPPPAQARERTEAGRRVRPAALDATAAAAAAGIQAKHRRTATAAVMSAQLRRLPVTGAMVHGDEPPPVTLPGPAAAAAAASAAAAAAPAHLQGLAAVVALLQRCSEAPWCRTSQHGTFGLTAEQQALFDAV